MKETRALGERQAGRGVTKLVEFVIRQVEALEQPLPAEPEIGTFARSADRAGKGQVVLAPALTGQQLQLELAGTVLAQEVDEPRPQAQHAP